MTESYDPSKIYMIKVDGDPNRCVSCMDKLDKHEFWLYVTTDEDFFVFFCSRPGCTCALVSVPAVELEVKFSPIHLGKTEYSVENVMKPKYSYKTVSEAIVDSLKDTLGIINNIRDKLDEDVCTKSINGIHNYDGSGTHCQNCGFFPCDGEM